MLEPKSISVLQEIFRRESLSFLQYMREAFPWADVGCEDRINAFQSIACADQAAIGALGSYLTKQKRGVPFVGTYPQHFTNFNFQSLDRLLPLLVQSQLASTAYLEQKHQELPEGEARSELGKLVDVKRVGLRRLEELATPVAKAG